MATPRKKNPKPGGRPTDYSPDLCERVIQFGLEGMSRAEMCYNLAIAFQTLRDWENAHPEFLEATSLARQIAQGWWEMQGRLGINARNFNANAYSLQVRNRFPTDWRDKLDHELDVSDPIKAMFDRINGKTRGLPPKREIP